MTILTCSEKKGKTLFDQPPRASEHTRPQPSRVAALKEEQHKQAKRLEGLELKMQQLLQRWQGLEEYWKEVTPCLAPFNSNAGSCRRISKGTGSHLQLIGSENCEVFISDLPKMEDEKNIPNLSEIVDSMPKLNGLHLYTEAQLSYKLPLSIDSCNLVDENEDTSDEVKKQTSEMTVSAKFQASNEESPVAILLSTVFIIPPLNIPWYQHNEIVSKNYEEVMKNYSRVDECTLFVKIPQRDYDRWNSISGMSTTVSWEAFMSFHSVDLTCIRVKQLDGEKCNYDWKNITKIVVNEMKIQGLGYLRGHVQSEGGSPQLGDLGQMLKSRELLVVHFIDTVTSFNGLVKKSLESPSQGKVVTEAVILFIPQLTGSLHYKISGKKGALELSSQSLYMNGSPTLVGGIYLQGLILRYSCKRACHRPLVAGNWISKSMVQILTSGVTVNIGKSKSVKNKNNKIFLPHCIGDEELTFTCWNFLVLDSLAMQTIEVLMSIWNHGLHQWDIHPGNKYTFILALDSAESLIHSKFLVHIQKRWICKEVLCRGVRGWVELLDTYSEESKQITFGPKTHQTCYTYINLFMLMLATPKIDEVISCVGMGSSAMGCEPELVNQKWFMGSMKGCYPLMKLVEGVMQPPKLFLMKRDSNELGSWLTMIWDPGGPVWLNCVQKPSPYTNQSGWLNASQEMILHERRSAPILIYSLGKKIPMEKVMLLVIIRREAVTNLTRMRSVVG